MDARQVYARDSRQPKGARLFYLPEGAVDEELRSLCRGGVLLCPFPDCPQPEYIAVGGTMRRHHFRHHPGPGGGEVGHGEPEWYAYVGRELIADWLRRTRPDLEVSTQVTLPRDARADVLAARGDGKRLAFFIFYAPLPPEDWQALQARVRQQGVVAVWLLGHLRSHLRHPRAHAHDPTGVTTAQWAEWTDLAAAMARKGVQPHWLHPDTRAIISPIPVAGGWHESPSGKRYVRVNHDNLEACRLRERRGMVTPSDTREVEAQREAERRAEAKRQQREQARARQRAAAERRRAEGAEERARAAQVAAIQRQREAAIRNHWPNLLRRLRDLPAPEDGTTRLYRIEGVSPAGPLAFLQAAKMRMPWEGRWFTDSLKTLESYRGRLLSAGQRVRVLVVEVETSGVGPNRADAEGVEFGRYSRAPSADYFLDAADAQRAECFD